MAQADQKKFAELAGRVARSRDRDAFAILFDYFAPRLKSYLQKLGMGAGQAEEITQDVMIVLWHKAHLFDSAKSSLATWLFRVARNRRIDALRRDRSHLIDPEDPIFRPGEPGPADEEMDAQKRDERIRLAMERLPDEQARLITYAFFDGMSHSQISEATGLPLGTVKSRIRLAFAKLRQLIDNDPQVDAPG